MARCPCQTLTPPLLHAQGEQVFISYGPQGNDSLLQFYGFVEAGNPDDTYRLPDVAVLARAAAASMGLDLRPERSTVPQEASGTEAAVRLILHATKLTCIGSLLSCKALKVRFKKAWTHMLRYGRVAALKTMMWLIKMI